jgi:hypothetical protein
MPEIATAEIETAYLMLPKASYGVIHEMYTDTRRYGEMTQTARQGSSVSP